MIKQILISISLVLMCIVNCFAQQKVKHKDPVCMMETDANSDWTFIKYKNEKYYFCSPICKEYFEKNPEKYLNNENEFVCTPAMPNYADSVNKGYIKEDKMKSSPRRVACYQYNDVIIKIEYGSPGVRGRTIWGGVVPYNEVWAAGAHSATKLTLTADAKVGGKQLFGGEYAVFFIPGEDNWELVINENYTQHLTDDYSESKDVLRLKLKPGDTAAKVQRLTYDLIGDAEKSDHLMLRFMWDHLFVEVPITLE